ncbi:MAG: tetratricopeptide repeat protein [Nitriliruptoraceae bacterium]
MTESGQLRARADQLLELHESGELDEALAAAEALEADAGDGDIADEVVRETLFTARFERALLLTEQGELDQAAEAYARAAATPADPDDPDQRHEVAMALLNRGICLETIGELEAALAAYQDLVDRYGDADDPVTADLVVRARTNRAGTLRSLDRPDEAIEELERIAAGLDAHEPLAVEQLLIGRRLRAAAARDLGRLEDALSAVSDLPGEDVIEPAVVVQRASADHDRAELLVELGRDDEAREVLDRLEALVAGDPDLADLADEVAATRQRLAAS